ncbi:hypothetical protein ACS0TY_033850 [Phlomoides rotata]
MFVVIGQRRDITQRKIAHALKIPSGGRHVHELNYESMDKHYWNVFTSGKEFPETGTRTFKKKDLNVEFDYLYEANLRLIIRQYRDLSSSSNYEARIRMEERCSVNSPRRILSFSKNRRANVSFPDVDHHSSTKLGVSGEHVPKLSEVYGFVGSITTVVFTEMQSIGVCPDEVTFKLIIRGLIKEKKTFLACGVWDQMMENGFTLDSYLPETLINATNSKKVS